MFKNFINKYYAFWIAAIAFLSDQIVKNIISENMLLNERIPLMHNVLSVTKIYNTGAAFGIFQNKTLFLAIFSVCVIVVISVYLAKKCKSLDVFNTIAWGLILGGTLGNFADRISIGYVLDFIKFDFVDFPVFNIADMCINIGAGLLLIGMLFTTEKQEEPEELPKEIV